LIFDVSVKKMFYFITAGLKNNFSNFQYMSFQLVNSTTGGFSKVDFALLGNQVDCRKKIKPTDPHGLDLNKFNPNYGRE
jgi:hypothetical protein